MLTSPRSPVRRVAVATLAAAVLLSAGALVAFGGGSGKDELPFGDLVGALRKTEGCLGVETANTGSGKRVIFAWFEDKAAVLRWYGSDVHRAAMDQFFPDRPPHRPLAAVPDGTGPILAVASLTLDPQPNGEAGGLPVRQMSIELFTPLPGGVSFGGTFAPPGAGARKTPPSGESAR